MGYKMITKNGYDYYAAMSAFQKSIRRCIEDETVFWGIELYESGFTGHLWNRIFIIAHEDIGLAEDNFTSKIISLKQAHDYLEKHRPQKVSKKLVMLQTFILLANAKKSRYTDLAYSVYWAQHDKKAKQNGGHPIPDYAYDMHTRKGKAMGRGLDHFYESSALINNANKMPLEEEFERLAHKIDIEESSHPTPSNEENPPESTQQGELF